jgi:hypothetical protein
MGYGYSPDRRNDRVNHDNLHSQFLGASGNRQSGFYYSPKGNESKSGGWKQSGSGAWYKD